MQEWESWRTLAITIVAVAGLGLFLFVGWSQRRRRWRKVSKASPPVRQVRDSVGGQLYRRENSYALYFRANGSPATLRNDRDRWTLRVSFEDFSARNLYVNPPNKNGVPKRMTKVESTHEIFAEREEDFPKILTSPILDWIDQVGAEVLIQHEALSLTWTSAPGENLTANVNRGVEIAEQVRKTFKN